jgi:hypothetical protein
LLYLGTRKFLGSLHHSSLLDYSSHGLDATSTSLASGTPIPLTSTPGLTSSRRTSTRYAASDAELDIPQTLNRTSIPSRALTRSLLVHYEHASKVLPRLFGAGSVAFPYCGVLPSINFPLIYLGRASVDHLFRHSGANQICLHHT